MSLMLLGREDEEASECATVTNAMKRPAPLPAVLCSNLIISADQHCATTDHYNGDVHTPVPTYAQPATNGSQQLLCTSTSMQTLVFPDEPHLSPVADKLHPAGSWKARLPTITNAAQRQLANQHEANKRAKKTGASIRLPTTVDDLFKETDESPVLPPHSAVADSTACADGAHDEVRVVNVEAPSQTHHLDEDGAKKQYCAVTGCLRVALHMEKCVVHKGMKLCCMSDCYRPVQSRGYCKSHGGGARCKHPGCKKGAISKGRCRTHGGGTRCAIPNCSKWAQRFGCCVRHSKAFTQQQQQHGARSY